MLERDHKRDRQRKQAKERVRERESERVKKSKCRTRCCRVTEIWSLIGAKFFFVKESCPEMWALRSDVRLNIGALSAEWTWAPHCHCSYSSVGSECGATKLCTLRS